MTQIAETEAASAEKWNFLATLEPNVTTLNRVDAVKPGATVLLTGTDESRRERPVLAFQRYGRGKAFALHAAGFVAVADARRDHRRGS